MIENKYLNRRILGSGDKDILGTDKSSSEFVDITLPHKNVTKIVSGNYSMIALTDDGKVYARGKNTYGELGLNHNNMVSKWTEIEFFKQKTITDVDLNRYHALFLDNTGCVYSCGSNSNGECVSMVNLTVRVL